MLNANAVGFFLLLLQLEFLKSVVPYKAMYTFLESSTKRLSLLCAPYFMPTRRRSGLVDKWLKLDVSIAKI